MDINREGEKVEQEYTRITNLLSSPEVIKDPIRFKEYSRSLKDLEPKIRTFKEYQKISHEVENLSKWLKKEKDSDMNSLVEEELNGLESKKKALETEWKNLLKPLSKEEQGNVIMEIRAGTGGEEAALFARDLFKMYSKFAEKKGWKIEIMDSNFSDRGGFKRNNLCGGR